MQCATFRPFSVYLCNRVHGRPGYQGLTCHQTRHNVWADGGDRPTPTIGRDIQMRRAGAESKKRTTRVGEGGGTGADVDGSAEVGVMGASGADEAASGGGASAAAGTAPSSESGGGSTVQASEERPADVVRSQRLVRRRWLRTKRVVQRRWPGTLRVARRRLARTQVASLAPRHVLMRWLATWRLREWSVKGTDQAVATSERLCEPLPLCSFSLRFSYFIYSLGVVPESFSTQCIPSYCTLRAFFGHFGARKWYF